MRDDPDVRSWKPCPSGVSSSRSFFKVIEEVQIVRLCGFLVWLGLAPSRAEVFSWLVVSRVVPPTVDNLRRGMLSKAISDMCVLCGKERETTDHLFLHSEYFFLWCQVISWSGVLWCSPMSVPTMIEA